MKGSKARIFLEVIIHVIFWLGLYYAMRALTSSSVKMMINRKGMPAQSIDARTMFPYTPVLLTGLMILFYSNAFWLFRKVMRYRQGWVRAAAVSGWFGVIFASNFLVIRALIGKPATPNIPPPPGMPPIPLMDGMNFLPRDWMHMQLPILLIFILVLGMAMAYFFVREWISNDLMRNEAKAQQLSAEVRFLRSQVNPHFLFNTLNNLFSMAQKEGNDDLAEGISTLSGMMRYMIYESNTEFVSLAREITYLQDCVMLHKLRYADDEVKVNFSYPETAAIANIQVAPVLFIPFLENAFKHGVAIGRRGEIDLRITVSDRQLFFHCTNTDYGDVKKLADANSGVGLDNVKRRLELLYPGRYCLETGTDSGKYIVNLQLDLA